ncbi:hypothetical protein H0H81_001237 [Sphagnurus paluster]|uniref:Uncharacterized protein n=1 Tax=Sphagnurus paluster TaxID=117069 RepID=A0A9P7KGW4_9AGAR|nr:hypothetical protein H0H81_001237 [Sphagnurus paluster]
MSSHCPPLLHLELPPNTTSFKRSFDQFGFDLDSPLGGSNAPGGSSSDGNDRNKRARSASSSSDDNTSIGSSQLSSLASGSGSTSYSSHEHTASQSAAGATRQIATPIPLNITRSSFDPPRLPTPEIQDIDMADYSLLGVEADNVEEAVVSLPSQADETYRISLERFNAFDTQISALRRSRSPSLPRSSTPPPVLPPLELLGEEAPINTNSFLHPPTRPSPPLPNSLYTFGPSRSHRPHSNTTSRDEARQGNFRRMPHETHTLGESSTTTRRAYSIMHHTFDGCSDAPLSHTIGFSQQTDEIWNRISQEARSSTLPVWPSYWPGRGHLDDDEESGEVSGARTHPAITRNDSPIPVIEELRSPSPLFDDLEEPRPPTHRVTRTIPPTLPPIQGHSETLDPLRTFSFDISRPDPSVRPTPQPNSGRISTSREPPSLRTENWTTSNLTARPPNADSTVQSHAFPSLFSRDLAGWMSDDSNGLSTDLFTPSSGGDASETYRSAEEPSTGAPFTTSSSSIDSYAASRLEALHGIGEALEDIGRVLQEREISLRPFLNNAAPASVTSRTGLAHSSLRGGSSESQTDWRSLSASASGEEPSTVPRRLRLSVPLPAPLEEHMRPWLTERRSRGESPPPVIERPRSITDIYARYTPAIRRAPSPELRPTTTDTNNEMADMLSWFSSAPSSQTERILSQHAQQTAAESPTLSWPGNTLEHPELETDPYPGYMALRVGRPADIRVNDRTAIAPTSSLTRHEGPQNDTGSLGSHVDSTTPSDSVSSTSANPVYYRTRPYVSHSTTHSHTHTLTQSYSLVGNRPGVRTSITSRSESASDAQRRNARLGLMQMQRQATTRQQPANAPLNTRRGHASAWIDVTSTSRQREREQDQHWEREMARERELSRERVARETRLLAQRENAFFSMYEDLDRGRSPVSSASARRPVPSLRERTSPTRFAYGEAPDSTSGRRRRGALYPIPPAERDTFRGYLPVPSIPSPVLSGVLDLITPSEPEQPAEHSAPVPRPSSPRRPRRSPERRTTRDLNPASFAPGPFRNTIQRFYEANLAREARLANSQSQAQSRYQSFLPPLPFEDEATPITERTHNRVDANTQPILGRYNSEAEEPSRRPLPRIPTFPEDRMDRWFADIDSPPERPAHSHRNTWATTTTVPARPPINENDTNTTMHPELHDFLSRRPRIEASRLEAPDRPRQSGATRGDEEGFTQALETLRHDGLSISRSQDLINRFHRERRQDSRSSTAAASPWGIIEQGTTARRATETAPPPSTSLPRGVRRRRTVDVDDFLGIMEPGILDSEDDSDSEGAAALIRGRENDRLRLLRSARRRPTPHMPPVFPSGVHEFMRVGGVRRGRALGDYMVPQRDEDFDESYESLLSLAASLGDVKPRCTPDSVIAGMDTGLYKDWKTTGCDHRCPICLDDYKPEDCLLKLPDCLGLYSTTPSNGSKALPHVPSAASRSVAALRLSADEGLRIPRSLVRAAG